MRSEPTLTDQQYPALDAFGLKFDDELRMSIGEGALASTTTTTTTKGPRL